MKVLFICKGNCFRSQMGAAIYNKLTNTKDATSAGTYVGASGEPEGRELPMAFKTTDFFELMEENGMNIRSNRTRKLLPEMLIDSDVVVSMAQEPYRPDFLKNDKKVIWWDVTDPMIATRENSENTYKKIHGLVTDLINTLKVNN